MARRAAARGVCEWGDFGHFVFPPDPNTLVPHTLVGLHAAVKPLFSHLIPGELNSPTNYVRTT
eukprot:1439736-Pyramimonas_sp.AAC.1